VEEFQLPNTDSPEVMAQAVSVWITGQVWHSIARAVRDEEAEKTISDIYDRVFRSVKKTHSTA
jgi:hypothetical protein